MAKITPCVHRCKDKLRVIGWIDGVKKTKYFDQKSYDRACHFLYECEKNRFETSTLTEVDKRKAFTVEKLIQYYIGWKMEEFENGRGSLQSIQTIISETKNYDKAFQQTRVDKLSSSQLKKKLGTRFYIWLRASLRHCHKLFGIDPEFIPKPPTQEKNKTSNVIKAPTDEAVIRLLESCREPRESMFIYLCAFLGLRVGEALAVRWEDVDHVNRRLSVNRHIVGSIEKDGTKGKYKRSVPFGSSFTDLVNELDKKGKYLVYNKHDPNKFVGRGAAYGGFIKDVFKRASVKFTPKELRKYYGTNSLNLGVTLSEVKDRMGHSSEAVTAKYYLYNNDGEESILSPTDRMEKALLRSQLP